MNRSSYYYRKVPDKNAVLRIRLKNLTGSRVRYDYRRLHILVNRGANHVSEQEKLFSIFQNEGCIGGYKTRVNTKPYGVFIILFGDE